MPGPYEEVLPQTREGESVEEPVDEQYPEIDNTTRPHNTGRFSEHMQNAEDSPELEDVNESHEHNESVE